MNNDYINEEMEIDLIELLKYILKNTKAILISTLVIALIIFGVTSFILPKSYTSSTDISIIPAGEQQDYTSYLMGNVVLNSVSKKLKIDTDVLLNSIDVTRDTSNAYNYNIKVTTNNPKLSYHVVESIVDSFKKEMMVDLNLSSITIINDAYVNKTPVSPNIKKYTSIGVLSGLLLNLMLCIIYFIFDKKFKNMREVEMFLGVDVLAEIPMEK